jgi:hypothetical protein
MQRTEVQPSFHISTGITSGSWCTVIRRYVKAAKLMPDFRFEVGHQIKRPFVLPCCAPSRYCPVPFSATLSGESLALSVMVMAAGSEPVVVGAKCPWMVQLDPAERVEPQLLTNT